MIVRTGGSLLADTTQTLPEAVPSAWNDNTTVSPTAADCQHLRVYGWSVSASTLRHILFHSLM